MNPNLITAKRIKELREEEKISQTEFCRRFCEFSHRKSVYTTMTISCWETGRKLPPVDVIINMAIYYGVSTDYLLGLVNERNSVYQPINTNITEKIEITYKELFQYDGQPIFISFPDGIYEDAWGILDFENEIITTVDATYKLNSKCKYYRIALSEESSISSHANRLLNMEEMMNLEKVYIESLSSDPFIQGKINGYYTHNESHEYLKNNIGMQLSYEGLGKYYNAYEKPIE